MASNAHTLHVKLMTGDFIVVDLPYNSVWPTHDIKCLIEKADRNLPYYYQTLLHIDPETNEAYTEPTPYHEGSLLLLMASPDVYIKEQEHFKNHDHAHKDMISIRYSIHVYAREAQRDMFSFLCNPKGFYLFTWAQTHDSRSWSHHVFGKSLPYVSTLQEAIASLPEMIRDEILRKWNSRDILTLTDPLPYTRQDDSDDEYDYE